MFTTDLVNLYNWNIFKTSLYIYIFQDEKCRLMRNLSLSMGFPFYTVVQLNLQLIIYRITIVILKHFIGKFFLYNPIQAHVWFTQNKFDTFLESPWTLLL